MKQRTRFLALFILTTAISSLQCAEDVFDLPDLNDASPKVPSQIDVEINFAASSTPTPRLWRPALLTVLASWPSSVARADSPIHRVEQKSTEKPATKPSESTATEAPRKSLRKRKPTYTADEKESDDSDEETAAIKKRKTVYKPIPSMLPRPCLECGKMLGCAASLRQHMLTHTGERPHACPMCKERFRAPHVLRDHVSTFHTRQNLLSCPEIDCDWKNAQASNLRYHLKDSHIWKEEIIDKHIRTIDRRKKKKLP